MKKMITSMILIATVVFLTACGGFNAKTAEEESRKALDNFFSSHDHKEVLIENSDVDEVAEYVENNFESFFSKEYMDTVISVISNNKNTKSKFLDPETFFLDEMYKSLKEDPKTGFYNAYNISDDKVNEDEKTVTYVLEPSESGVVKNGGVIEMVLEDGKWRINSFQQ